MTESSKHLAAMADSLEAMARDARYMASQIDNLAVRVAAWNTRLDIARVEAGAMAIIAERFDYLWLDIKPTPQGVSYQRASEFDASPGFATLRFTVGEDVESGRPIRAYLNTSQD